MIENFDCLDEYEEETVDEHDDTEDEWEDDGGNDNDPVEDPYDESQRKPIWWYHSDHLGSSSYITDNFGRPSHYYEYLPFGELMTEHNQSKYYLEPYPTQNMDSYNNPYKFNGKEMDRETGMYYYGARYYDPRISIFISVDPLAEQAPNWTPYRYAFNNPIMVTDPTGLFETRFGAWWHKQWNGDDSSSEIMYNDKRKEYYYTNHSSFIDEEGNEGLYMEHVYSSQKGDAGRFVFEIEGGASVGVQVGIRTGWGRLEGGIITGDVGKIGWSTEEENNAGFYADWGDGTGHNFINAGVGLDKTKLSIGGGIDYVTPDIVPPGGDIGDYYSNNGKTIGSLSIGPKTNLWNPSKGSRLDGMGSAVRTRARANTNNDYTTDLSFGLKAIIGLDLRIKFGVTGKKN